MYPPPPPRKSAFVEAEFPEEDAASKREHFEKRFPVQLMWCFLNSQRLCGAKTPEWGGGTWVEVLVSSKSKSPSEALEVGMQRRIAGIDETITKEVSIKLVEYKINAGMPTSYHKARILFKPEEEGKKTRVIWTIRWTPDNVVANIMYTVAMQGFFNLALYRLEQKVATGTYEKPDKDATEIESEESSTDFTQGALKDGESSKLQSAARMFTGYEGNLTEQQQQALNELKEDLETMKRCGNLETGPSSPGWGRSRHYSFLRAECTGKLRKFNVAPSKKRLGETLQFRRDVKADQMLIKTPPKFGLFAESGNEYVLFDREGRLVVFTRAGILSTHLDTKMQDNGGRGLEDKFGLRHGTPHASSS